MQGVLQTREGKSVRRLPLFCFDIFEHGVVREVAEKLILIYVLNGNKNEISFLELLTFKHSRPSVQHG